MTVLDVEATLLVMANDVFGEYEPTLVLLIKLFPADTVTNFTLLFVSGLCVAEAISNTDNDAA
jgi:hypothetical protein